MGEILEALKIKFEGFSEKQLEVKANSMERKGLTVADVDSLSASDVIEAYADYRTNTALRSNNGRQSAQGGQQITNNGHNQNGGDGVSADVKALIEQVQALATANQTLTSRLDTMQTSAITATRQAQLSKLIETLPASMQNTFKHVKLDQFNDEDFQTYMAETQQSVDAIKADLKSSGVTFSVPNANANATGNEATTQEMNDLYKDR